MNPTATQELITLAVGTLGASILVILATCLSIGVALLVFKFGWDKIFYDKSFMIGGFYVRNVPYKGYNRWRSKSWNMKHTM